MRRPRPSRFRRFLFAAAVLFAFAGPLPAQEGGGDAPEAVPAPGASPGAVPESGPGAPAATEAGRISAVTVAGLKRTRPAAAENPLRKFIGADAARIDLDEVRAAVLATGILEPLSVEVRAGGTPGARVLAVTVREKWALFPIPVVMIGSGGFSAGGAFFDANAFGLNDKLFIAGLYRSEGWLASVGYIHASPAPRVPGWTGVVNFSRGERRDTDQKDRALRRFDQDSLTLMAGLSYPLLANSDLLSVSLNLSFEEKVLRNPENAWNGPDAGPRSLGAGAEIAFRKNGWDGYLLSREEASLRYGYQAASAGRSYHSVRFRGTYEKSLVPGFRLNLRTGLAWEPGVPVFSESSPQAAQVSILPQSYSARHYAGASAGLEKYLVKFSPGTVSLAASYQIVYSRGSVLPASLDHGVAGMLSFYLSKLAIPALGLGAAYNVKAGYLQASFSMGMSF